MSKFKRKCKRHIEVDSSKSEITNQFTHNQPIDIMDIYKMSMEELRMAVLRFNDTNKQIVYASVDKGKLNEIIRNQSVPNGLIAYEHIENARYVAEKNKQAVIVLELDTSKILDLTSINGLKLIKHNNVIDVAKANDTSVIRRVQIKVKDTNIYYMIEYEILNSSPVGKIVKA